jgi:hypothetical protein
VGPKTLVSDCNPRPPSAKEKRKLQDSESFKTPEQRESPKTHARAYKKQKETKKATKNKAHNDHRISKLGMEIGCGYLIGRSVCPFAAKLRSNKSFFIHEKGLKYPSMKVKLVTHQSKQIFGATKYHL